MGPKESKDFEIYIHNDSIGEIRLNNILNLDMTHLIETEQLPTVNIPDPFTVTVSLKFPHRKGRNERLRAIFKTLQGRGWKKHYLLFKCLNDPFF